MICLGKEKAMSVVNHIILIMSISLPILIRHWPKDLAREVNEMEKLHALVEFRIL